MQRSASGVLLSVLLGCGPACAPDAAAPSPEPLSVDERKAVTAAEAFVRDNCYTRFPCNKAKMRPEFMESAGIVDVLYKVRHNQLKTNAYGISPGTRPGVDPGWTVYFEPTPEWLRSIPRCCKATPSGADPAANPGLRGLYVNRSFEVLFVEHVDLRRDAAKKLAYVTESPR